MNKFFEKLMVEMCDRVGAEWKFVNPKEQGWFMKFSWTEKEQESFVVWAVDYLYNSNSAREAMLTQNIKNKKLIRQAMDKFVLLYGWKIV